MNFVSIAACSVVLVLILSNQISSQPVDEYKNTLEYLETFGYLTKEEKFELTANADSEKLYKRKLFIRALRDLQVSESDFSF
jgi:hypothetical protein